MQNGPVTTVTRVSALHVYYVERKIEKETQKTETGRDSDRVRQGDDCNFTTNNTAIQILVDIFGQRTLIRR